MKIVFDFANSCLAFHWSLHCCQSTVSSTQYIKTCSNYIIFSYIIKVSSIVNNSAKCFAIIHISRGKTLSTAASNVHNLPIPHPVFKRCIRTLTRKTGRRFSTIVFYLPLHKFWEKTNLKILASWFLMHYSSKTFEAYQRIKIYTYSVNGLDLKKFYSNMEFMGILQFVDRTLCPRNRCLHSVL